MASSSGNLLPVVLVADDGDVILNITFETSRETIAVARKTQHPADKKTAESGKPQPDPSPRMNVAYRVKLYDLKKHSKYFANLLGNRQFSEAAHVEAALARLRAAEFRMDKVDVSDLPWVNIVDDDESTRSVGREKVFEDLMRIWNMLSSEDLTRTELWWNLPDSLERELQYRRECILNTIASIQRHFLALYSSRERQCQLGYDSSSACDSFQLGQMLKFFTGKELIGVVDFGPNSFENIPDPSVIDIEDILSTLKQVPSYQIDKNHTNCGIRTRIEPILDYVRSMLSSTVLSISQADWKNDRVAASWITSNNTAMSERGANKFEFTRGLATDQRLRHEGYIHADKMARILFTADEWDWTPED
ncbi:hypothetical protein CTRI78_v012037 [Colletotrichum trifolii]|uniref:Uncharacterized protein n=1 Tax=Colletotrichum trifolii TaxID=5466 RepID=A0A4R8PRK4_COLTR|nr:hypothetical protein CTRI78_v012037 [Colletotrichum trifolii]